MMKRLVAGLLAVTVFLACVAANDLCLGDQSEAGFDTAGKTETGSPIKIKTVPKDEAYALGENIVPLKLVPEGEASAGGVRIKTVFVPSKTEILPPENVPEVPQENVPPENVPPEQPPKIPPGMEIRNGYWVSTAKPALHSARDTPLVGSGNLRTVETISAEEASKLENMQSILARAKNEETA